MVDHRVGDQEDDIGDQLGAVIGHADGSVAGIDVATVDRYPVTSHLNQRIRVDAVQLTPILKPPHSTAGLLTCNAEWL